jgi:hypothetical protein
MKMNPELLGKTVQLNVTIGYPGSRVSDLWIGGVKVSLDNDALFKAMELSGLSPVPSVIATSRDGNSSLVAVEKTEKDV